MNGACSPHDNLVERKCPRTVVAAEGLNDGKVAPFEKVY